jgi:hypothetical protein
MLAHSSHLLQPLDVTCFSVLKRAYGKLIEAKTRIRVHHIDKLDFLPALKQAWIEAFKTSNIKSSFAAAGLVPLDPEQVISKLNIRIRTPTPPPSRGSVTSSKYSPKTPKTAREARRQAISIIRARQHNVAKSDQAVKQMQKALELAFDSHAILKRERDELLAEVGRKERKKQRSNRRLVHETGLSKEEALELIQPKKRAVEPPKPLSLDQEDEAILAPRPAVRAPGRCSGCGALGHTYPKCSNRG